MTVPGLDMMWDGSRWPRSAMVAGFGSPQKLVSYLGLKPQRPANQAPGRPITAASSKQGSRPCAGLLVKQPGLRRGRLVRCGHSSCDRGVAASTLLAVATARESSLSLSGTFLSKEQDYLWVASGLHATKLAGSS